MKAEMTAGKQAILDMLKTFWFMILFAFFMIFTGDKELMPGGFIILSMLFMFLPVCYVFEVSRIEDNRTMRKYTHQYKCIDSRVEKDDKHDGVSIVIKNQFQIIGKFIKYYDIENMVSRTSEDPAFGRHIFSYFLDKEIYEASLYLIEEWENRKKPKENVKEMTSKNVPSFDGKVTLAEWKPKEAVE